MTSSYRVDVVQSAPSAPEAEGQAVTTSAIELPMLVLAGALI